MSIPAIEQFRQTGKELTEVLESFTQEELNTVPFEGSWTPGQVADHIRKAVINTPDVLNGPTIPADREPDQKVAQIRSIFLDFTTKMKSPDYILPGNGPFDKEALVGSLASTWEQLAELNETMDLSPICTMVELPNSGPMTRYEWMAFGMIHTQRHIHQLREIAERM